jgi:hypothetical protein
VFWILYLFSLQAQTLTFVASQHLTGFQTMNASEIEFIEARLPVSLQKMPSPEQMDQLLARAKRQRSEQFGDAFAAFVEGTKSLFAAVRRIAADCTSARLHREHHA